MDRRRKQEFFPGPQIPEYVWQEVNREEDAKLGGGIGVLFKSNGALSVWEGVKDNAERLWVTYENGKEKHAFCGVYLAVKPYKGRKAEDMNMEILALIQLEMSKLTAQGYSVSLCGDFNSWLGTSGRYGMRENRDQINPNGEILIDFMTPLNLKLANKYDQAEGVYTRYPDRREGRPSVLDLIILEEDMYDKMTGFSVDEDNTFGVASDHRLVVFFVFLLFITENNCFNIFHIFIYLYKNCL